MNTDGVLICRWHALGNDALALKLCLARVPSSVEGFLATTQSFFFSRMCI